MTNESTTNTPSGSFVDQARTAIRLAVQYPCIVLAGYWQDRRDERAKSDSLSQLGRAALDPAFNDSDLINLQREAAAAVKEVDHLTMSIADIEGAAMPDNPEARSEEVQRRKKDVDPLRQKLTECQTIANAACIRLGELVLERAPQHAALSGPVARMLSVE